MSIRLDKNTFACRFYNVYSQKKFDQNESNTIRQLSELAWDIGYYDGLDFDISVNLKIESAFREITYIDIDFNAHSISDKVITIYFSHLLESQIDKYAKTSGNSTIDYFFDKKYINDPSWWYTIWKPLADFEETLNKLDYDVLRIVCTVSSTQGTQQYENFIEYKNLTYGDSFISGGFDAQVDEIVQDTVHYSFVFGNKKEHGLTNAEYDYIKTHFRSYEYFLIEVDDFGNHHMVKKDIVFTLSDTDSLQEGKIIRSFEFELDDSIFIDSVILLCRVHFDVSNELLREKISTTVHKYEYSYFDPDLNVSYEKGNFTIGENYDQNRSISEYLYKQVLNINSVEDLKALYVDIDKLYGQKMIPYDVESMFVKIGLENQTSYYFFYIILTVMKNAIRYWDNFVMNNNKVTRMFNSLISWNYINDSRIKEFAIMIYVNDDWKMLARHEKGFYYNPNNKFYEFKIEPKYFNNKDGEYKVRIMQINRDGVWSYSPELYFLFENGKIIGDDEVSLDYSFISNKDPFKWERLRKIFDIEWDVWSLIIKEYFTDKLAYETYQTLINEYTFYYWDQYISFNDKIEFYGFAPGMTLDNFKEENPDWSGYSPFPDINDEDIVLTYAKFKAHGYPSIYMRTAFLYVEPYFYNNEGKKQYESVDKGGIKALIYKKTFAESLNNIGIDVPINYGFLNNVSPVNNYFDDVPVYYRNDLKQHPVNIDIDFWDFNEILDTQGFFDSIQYNDYVKGEYFYVLYFINKTVYKNHHVKFFFTTPTGVTLEKAWWDDRSAGDVTSKDHGNLDNFITKRFNKKVLYWDGFSKEIIDKYTPNTSTGNIQYKEIEDEDLDIFYNRIEITSVNSVNSNI